MSYNSLINEAEKSNYKRSVSDRFRVIFQLSEEDTLECFIVYVIWPMELRTIKQRLQ